VIGSWGEFGNERAAGSPPVAAAAGDAGKRGQTKDCTPDETSEVRTGWAGVSGPPGSQKVMSRVPLATRAVGRVA
jgi:hypothetical protein